MSFLDEIREDCAEAESDLGNQSLTWNGTDYPCAQSTLRRGETLIVGGKDVEIRFTVRVRVRGDGWVLNPIPKSGQRATYQSKEYRIGNVNDAHRAFVEIDLIDPNR